MSQPGFALTAANVAVVTQVCRRLDGIPLAIELAAARMKALPVEKIAERLDDRFRLLTGGSRTALPRQQTLRALIDWSYNLLSEPERILLRRVSVFAGGWTLEAAEAVCADPVVSRQLPVASEGRPSSPLTTDDCLLPSDDVLDLLTSLVEKSLVLYEEQGDEARYRLLETVRQYARDRLLETGEAAAVRGRHRDWCLALAERAEPELYGAEHTAWRERLEREHDNLRAALAWSQTQGQAESGLRLGGALGRFWDLQGYSTEGREHLVGLLTLPGAEARTAARAKALQSAGMLAAFQWYDEAARAQFEESLAISGELGDKEGIAWSLQWLARVAENNAAARVLDEESLAIFRELRNKKGIAWALAALGRAALEQEEYVEARALLEESLEICRELDDKLGITISLSHLGCMAREQGDYVAARALLEENLAIHRELRSKRAIAWALDELGWAVHGQGDVGAARALFEESWALFRELGDKEGIPWAPMTQGHVLLELGDYRAARSCYEEGLALRRAAGKDSILIGAAFLEVGHAAWLQGEPAVTQSHAVEALGLFRELGNQEGLLAALESLAVAALAQRRKERAARLLGAVAALRETLGLHGPSWWRRPRERIGEAVRAASLEQECAAAWEAGRALSLEQAIALALREPAPPAEP